MNYEIIRKFAYLKQDILRICKIINTIMTLENSRGLKFTWCTSQDFLEIFYRQRRRPIVFQSQKSSSAGKSNLITLTIWHKKLAFLHTWWWSSSWVLVVIRPCFNRNHIPKPLFFLSVFFFKICVIREMVCSLSINPKKLHY